MIRQCVICGNSFETKRKSKTCSSICTTTHKRNVKRAWSKNNPDKVRVIEQRTRNKRKINGKQRAYQIARRSSKDGYIDRFIERISANTPDTDIDRDYLYQLMENDRCNLTNVAFVYKNQPTAYHNPYAPSIDRIDSSVGYYKDNIQIVLVAVNFAKHDMPNEEFIKVWSEVMKSSMIFWNGSN